MGTIKVDLKQFKHLKSDDKSTTLRHKDGHEITLAHSALTPDNQKALQALAQASQTPADAQEARMQKPMAKGGKVEKYPNTINADSAAAGIKKAHETREQQPYGATVVVPEKQQPIGKVKLMAEGGNPLDPGGRVEQEDNDQAAYAKQLDPTMQSAMKGELPVDAAKPPDTVPVPDPNVQGMKDLYNQKIAANGIASQDDMFGPNGEPPKNPVNPSVWGTVENSSEAQRNVSQELQKRQDVDKASNVTQEQQNVHDKAVAQNAVNAKLGIPLVPDPGAPTPQSTDTTPAQAVQTPDSGQQPATGATPSPAQAANSPSFDPESMLKSGYQHALQGIAGEAEAKGQLGQQQAEQYQKQYDANQQAQQHYQNAVSGLNQERQNFIDDIRNGHIDPNQYWTGDKDGNGGHSKIATGIGMILAGFNPTSNPNAAINFLKYQMDKNMEGQVQNLGAKKSLLFANMQQFQNIQQAQEMTRVMQNDALVNQINMEAAKSASPLAKAAAQQAAGTLQMDSANRFRQLSLMNAMTNMAKDANANPDAMGQMLGYMRAVNPEMAKTYEPLYVPGVGLAKVPVPETIRQQITTTKSVNDLMNRSLEFSKQHQGTLSPSLRAQAATIQNQLVGVIKQAQHDGVYKPSEAEFLTSQIGGSPASFVANMSSVPKIKELQQIKQNEYNNILSTYGLPKQQLAGQPANDVMTGKDGKQYRRQGNYMVPVQAPSK